MSVANNSVLISLVRDTYPDPDTVARDICATQPIDPKVWSDFYEAVMRECKSTAQLKAEGYRPVSRFGLMWIKDEK